MVAVGRRLITAVVACSLALGVSGCVSAGRPETGATTKAVAYAPPSAIAPYLSAVHKARALGLDVWLDADLAGRWRAGPATFRAGVAQVARLADATGVQGVRVANELGQGDPWWTTSRLTAFFADVDASLRSRTGRRLQIAVDVVVPELGCLPGSSSVGALACRADALKDPITLTSLGAVASGGHLDRLIVGPDLLDPAVYRSWGTSVDQAATAAWQTLLAQPWASQVDIQARKALTFPLPYDSAASAAADLPTACDVPLDAGVPSMDVWAWQRTYQGVTVGLLGPNASTNPLWAGLQSRADRGDVLYTQFSPSQVRTSVSSDLRTIASVFSGVYIAAGTG